MEPKKIWYIKLMLFKIHCLYSRKKHSAIFKVKKEKLR